MTLPKANPRERFLTLIESPPPADVIPFPVREPITADGQDILDQALLVGALGGRPEQTLVFRLMPGLVLVLIGRIGRDVLPFKADVYDALDTLTRYLTGHHARVCNELVRHLSHLQLGPLIDGGRFSTNPTALIDCLSALAGACQAYTAESAARSRCKTKHPNASIEELTSLLPNETFWQQAFEGFLIYEAIE